MRARRLLIDDHEQTRELWPAFTDVMSTVAIILFVLVLLAYARNLINGKHLAEVKKEIATSARELRNTDAELRRSRADLRASEDKRDGQDRIIADSNRQLDLLRTELQSVSVLRVSVLAKLKAAIEAELGQRDTAGRSLVSLGDDGNIVLNERLVFESNSFAIRQDARVLLSGLARALGALLSDPGIRDNIEEIVIEGHTDERGTAAFNWDLSAKRATAVLEFLFASNAALADDYGRYFAANAHSKFRPINPGQTPEAYQENRRIEISVVPRDSNIRKIIDEYMRTVEPSTGPAGEPGGTPPR